MHALRKPSPRAYSAPTVYTTSRKRLRTKVTLDLHLTYSKNGGNVGLVLKR